MAEADRLRLAARVQADYDNYGYAPLLAADMRAVAGVGSDVATSVEATANLQAAATLSAAQAAAAATTATSARTAAENAVASVTIGSTANLAYPEQVRNLITTTDVVDVLVYDTRLDSDGGAWTERCTGASWYQETLNTATRGAKRSFPKVALIVLRTSILTIYDALELDANSVPRLWMSFTGNDNTMLRAGGLLSICAAEGRIYRGANGRGIVEIDFASDCALSYWNGALSRRENIANRNVSNAALYLSLGVTLSTVGYTTGLSVDARAMPGAPRGGPLGLLVPTLLAAGDGGLEVTHPGPRTCLITLTNGYRRARFTADARIAAIAVNSNVADLGPLPYAATIANTAWRTHRIGSTLISGSQGIITTPAQTLLQPQNLLVDLSDDAIAQQDQLHLIAEANGNLNDSLIASIGANFTTGWMHNATTRLATLGGANTGSIGPSADLVLNGTNPVGLTSWTITGNVTVSSGQFVHDMSAGNTSQRQALTTVAGEAYELRMTLVTGSINVSVGTTSGATDIAFWPFPTGAGVFSFIARSATTWINIGSNVNFTVEAISCRLVTAELSPYRGAGLRVVGSLSRAAAATGSDLVAWSGFGPANSLEQPYNPNLDFGTGDFSIALWINAGAACDNAMVFSRENPAGNGLRLALSGFANAVPIFSTRNSAGTTITQVLPSNDANGSLKNTGWRFLVLARRSSVLEFWIDGIRISSAADTTNLTNTSASLRVGDVAPFSLVLLRVAGFAPTPGQIARIYRDEAPLLQANAKAFLGMAASATVKRIARSRFSNQLSVGMSDGLAVFHRLQRVERQTSATLSPAMASNDVTAISSEAGCTLIGTASNIGARRAAITGLDQMPLNLPTSGSLRIIRARGVTTDATPLVLAPRIPIGERETVTIWASVTGRVYGASDTQRLTYERRATYVRDAGGNVTLAGAVQIIGTDIEVTSTADATLVIDTTAQTVAPQVTGIAATRLAWQARIRVERSTHETAYEEVA